MHCNPCQMSMNQSGVKEGLQPVHAVGARSQEEAVLRCVAEVITVCVAGDYSLIVCCVLLAH